MIGKTLSHYKITEQLGKGGMGEVYLADDTTLDRKVALKFLSDVFTGNPERMARFEREAKLLASLNHPNIAAIYGLEQSDGNRFLVLEYVEGETLKSRLSKGALPLDEALVLCRQIAEGLDGAHEKGVIHRDLKPANVMITAEEKVKILDFGLAKALADETQSVDLSDCPTITGAMTRPGVMLGTAAYMSPEQAKGKAVDKRADIWAFGCILYECLKGNKAFGGETATDMVARVLEREPDWQTLPQKTPANIRLLIRRCLEKNPQQRLQHIGDAILEIHETLNPPINVPPLTGPPAGYSRSVLITLAAVCVLVGLIIGAIAVKVALNRANLPEQSPLQVLRTSIKLPEDQTLALSRSTPLGWAQPAIALSPDGSHLAYVADVGDTTRLFLRPLTEFEAKPIPGTEGAFYPFFSPDGQWIGFFTKDKLKKVSVLGGDPIPLCDARNPRGACWGKDGMITFAHDQGSELMQISTAGGATARLIARTDCNEPQVLPGGNGVLISGDSDIAVISPQTGKKRTLINNGYHARYLPTGHLVYARAGILVAVPFDLTALKVTGEPVPVLEKVLLDSLRRRVQYTFSGNGMLVYIPGGDTARSTPVWVDRQGTIDPLPVPMQIYGVPSLSPDGRRLAIEVYTGYKKDIFVYDIASGRSTRLTMDGNSRYPVWTPDSERVVYTSYIQAQKKWAMLWKSVDGSDEAKLLYESDYSLTSCSWSPDGKVLIFVEGRPDTGSDILALSQEGAGEPELIIGTEATEWTAAFSPDGRYIAYTSDRDAKFQVYVQPYPGRDWIRQISDDFGEEQKWSSNGDELFYRNGDQWMVVSISTEPQFTAGTSRVLFEGPYKNVPGVSYDVAPGARRLLVLQPEHDDSEVRELQVVHNWFEELKQRVPVD